MFVTGVQTCALPICSEQERVVAIVTEAMESAAALKVRLVVDYGVGGNWLEAH